ncbi:expressed unknown protein [Seminavis robusta]|uniref:Uncharacterized protein n=1 Tax=Seminavis robusta TaxID=568900 RepID=A0A9N8HK41_9STRA|nr:expressed unknown protein [Seminavis robusta]|eukprot:Sro591_g172000.1 n/a (376) ;mRNA; r:20947-22074
MSISNNNKEISNGNASTSSTKQLLRLAGVLVLGIIAIVSSGLYIRSSSSSSSASTSTSAVGMPIIQGDVQTKQPQVQPQDKQVKKEKSVKAREKKNRQKDKKLQNQEKTKTKTKEKAKPEQEDRWAQQRQNGWKQRDPYIQKEGEIIPPTTFSKKQELKVPFPIFVLNLPKSGTTTLWQYFECGLGPDRAVHWWTKGKNIGPCVHYNIQQQNNQLPLHRCGNFDVWLDFGYTTPTECFFPAVQGLKPLYQSYPNATFLLIRRETDSWYNSAKKWGNAKKWGKMFDRWKQTCRNDFFPNKDVNATIQTEDFRQFYDDTTQRIRQFAKKHPGMRYLEPKNLTLSSPELGDWLQENIGIESSCWGKCKPDGLGAKCSN